jgi:CRP/FNR family cyclic AMP-dependent transcriptional regulator
MPAGTDAERASLPGRDAVVALLGSNRVLRHIAKPDLHHLLDFSRVRRFRRRASLIVAGDAGAAVYAVLEGYVKLSRTNPSGREIVLEVAAPGSIFGELAVINGWKRSADAIALSDCRVLAIDGRQFMDALRRNPEATFAIVRNLSERLVATSSQMEDALFLPATARIARALIRLAALNSQPTSEGLQIEVAMSQRELGNVTGLARESINKQLAAWREEKIIRLEGAHITLSDPAALQAIAERVTEPPAR